MEQATDTLPAGCFEKQKKRSLKLRVEPLSERFQRLRSLEVWVRTNRERIRQAVHLDFQKPTLEVDTSEVYPVLTELRHALKHLGRWAAPKKIDATLAYVGTRAEVRYEPKGVCLIISPWNYPFSLSVGPLVSCLAAGNNAIIKPSEMTPHTSRLLKELAEEVFEDDVVHVVQGGITAAQQLLTLPFDHIFFTGSSTVGKLVMKAAADHLSSITLELGGKSPAVVDASANLKDAARRIAFGKYVNNGQTCIAPDYVLVDGRIKDKFTNQLKEEILKLFGNGQVIDENSPSYARLVNERHFIRIAELLKDATDRGARAIRLGESNPKTNFIAPVILTDVPPGARVLEEEIFGPLLPLRSFTSAEELFTIINGGPKPLAMYIFSQRKSFQEALLSNTSAGGVCINDCMLQFTHPNLPFGGVNNSGIGKSHGESGFLSFSNEKSLLRQRSGWTPPYLVYPPYTKNLKKIVDVLLKWF